ncbi:aminotransferase class V-fold PLP-dependent enzyme [Conexibacter sp. JD483]|uniref:aminotransferase class V-fold PLP-dependent enzyme n=1 Tax=unclassified Conexibacter TaxID=2627773 RepID=UPI00271D59D7|nr:MULTISPECIES: aminotransferase class V-fold PLP-dependent enzyme [unclassified Conexibacter]MDO8186117.1 aminotransferase class V-fold PLP-dependent enzyme [Conexibacter sp. CPCC 205706]MDO8199607.1 aminotransferase class V-fold PLP-dependent enzyme [Conexibacter sp. CPCC 205762]MDR9369139.1 aminotransferase class V-fold PLP-dependent enzyme [Conexibacter sp. JD483]
MTTGNDTLAELRAQFPVVQRLAYLNAGTNGPIATAAADAVAAQQQRETEEGRGGMPFFLAYQEQADRLRAGYAAYLHATPEEVALTTSTTDGVSRILLALNLGAGDEILTSDEEHPGVYGPLVAQRARGVSVRTAPFASLAEAIAPATKLVVASHVSWRSGAYAPIAALAAAEPLLLLDGAQGVGAVPTDVHALGADFYAGAGQKWLCGPTGTGMLWIHPRVRERLAVPSPGYLNLADAGAGLDAVPREDAQAFDTPSLSSTGIVHAVAMLDLFAASGWDAIHARAHDLAELAVAQLRERGREVLARDRTTLVTWREAGAPEQTEKLLEAGVVVRHLPDEDVLRASFGGWSSEQDLERLLDALPA